MHFSPLSVTYTRAFLFGMLALAALLVYAQSLGNEFVIWDDDTLITQNPLTQEITPRAVWGAFTSYDPELYVPLTIVSFQLERAVFGLHPFFYHLDNLILHVIVAGLIMLVLERFGLKRQTAFLGALVFVLHPVNTEAVAWASARKDLLTAVFSLSALLLYRRNAWMTFLLFLLALLSKPIAIVLPVIFLLMDWKESGKLRGSDLKNKIPFFALSMLFLGIGLYGKQRNIEALSVLQTLLLAAKSTIFSVQTFLLPIDLSPIYLQTDPISITLAQFWIPTLILIGMAITCIWSLRHTRAVTFSIIFFMIFLVPSFSNFSKESSVYFFSDRYIYLSQIGLLFLIGYAADRWLNKQMMIGAATVTAVIVGALGWTAHAQSLLWKDSETLYRDALEKNDRSVVMHYNLGLLEQRRGDRQEAFDEYMRALAIDPSYAKAHNNLGVWYKDAGQPGKALEELRLAIDSDPGLSDAYNNRGAVLMDQGDIDGAIAEYRKAIALRETFAQAHINLAAALGRKGLYEEGLLEYKRAFELAPQLLDGLPEVRKALENL